MLAEVGRHLHAHSSRAVVPPESRTPGHFERPPPAEQSPRWPRHAAHKTPPSPQKHDTQISVMALAASAFDQRWLLAEALPTQRIGLFYRLSCVAEVPAAEEYRVESIKDSNAEDCRSQLLHCLSP